MEHPSPYRAPAAAVMGGVRSLTFEVQHFVERAARGLGMHRTDIEVIGLIIDADRHGERLTPGRIARHARLSAAAVSALLDRLEKNGHAVRSKHERDGRMVFIDVTDEARAVSRETFAPLTRSMSGVLENYSPEELEVAARVIGDLAAAARASSRIDIAERPLAP